VSLGVPEDSLPLLHLFERFFEAESVPARVRASEPVGFDAGLWRDMVKLGFPLMRVAAESGGGGASLFDTALLMAEAGRRLASAPLAESIVTLGVLSALGGNTSQAWIDRIAEGETIATLALHPIKAGQPQLVPGAAVAKGVLIFDGAQIAIVEPHGAVAAPGTLGGCAIGRFDAAAGVRTVIASGPNAETVWRAGIEEWKLLTASALLGLSDQALSMAAAYACQRIQFDVPIGRNQGISHPLANDVIDVDGGRLLLWRAISALAHGDADAAALISMVWWWAAGTATQSVAHALHTFGGYGLTNEYDIQLYHRRAKAWAMPLGDPADELLAAGERLFGNRKVSLPAAGAVAVNFSLDPQAEALAKETRAFFERILTPELRAKAHYSFDGHDWGVNRALAAERLLFPGWPEQWGGRDASPEAVRASRAVWDEFDWTPTPSGVSHMVGTIVMKFGTAELQQEVLPRMAAGEIIASLGYSEPSSGSDVFAARTRAVRDGDQWLINGQKMFTSGAELASYVMLLTRTDPEAPKHKGLTLFLVPLDSSGIEIRPVYTFMDERTNATFYTDVRISDRYRLGEVNGGVAAMAAALSMEQGANNACEIDRMMCIVANWAKEQGRLTEPRVLSTLAKVSAHARISECLAMRVGWAHSQRRDTDKAYGPASKVFSTEAFIRDSAELLDLTAPESLVRGRTGLGYIEEKYRHSTATAIYGGTSEVLRSLVAERRLGLPRSRA
jgi:alkylation response protein AidB-like acyl-CoA dehydrogenase